MIRTRRGGLDLVGLVRTTNSLQKSDEEWLLQIQQGVGRIMPEGPMVGYLFDLSSSAFQIRSLCSNCDEDFKSIQSGIEPLLGEAFDIIYRSVGSGSGRQAFSSFGMDWPAETTRIWGINDSFGVMAGGRSGHGVTISLGFERACNPNPRDIAFWTGFSHCLRQSFEIREYLANARRQRDRDGSRDTNELSRVGDTPNRQIQSNADAGDTYSKPSLSEIEQHVAILDHKGNLQNDHADAKSVDMRQYLREHVLMKQRNYAELNHSDPQLAAEIWEGTRQGKWMIIDQFDSDGRQFWVALRTPGAIQSLLGLSERERKILAYAIRGQTQKWIAVELNIHASAVNRALESALLKIVPDLDGGLSLGARSSRAGGHDQFDRLLTVAKWVHCNSRNVIN